MSQGKCYITCFLSLLLFVTKCKFRQINFKNLLENYCISITFVQLFLILILESVADAYVLKSISLNILWLGSIGIELRAHIQRIKKYKAGQPQKVSPTNSTIESNIMIDFER